MAITKTFLRRNSAVRQASELPEEQNPERIPKESRTTDKDGNITQYDAYLPYGELLVDEHSSSEEMPYKFNGKEFDEETGLYYYGARYMNPVASIWYGVDPLTEMLPSTSAYVYCYDNPIKITDPDGNIGVIGFFIGAGTEYAMQVACNVINNGLSSESFTNVDAKSIIISGVAGAVGVGISSVATKAAKATRLARGISKGSKIGKAIDGGYQVAADAVSSVIGQKMQGDDVDKTSTAIDVAFGAVGRKATNLIKAKRAPKQRILDKDAKRAERMYGDKADGTSKAARRDAAKKNATTYGNRTKHTIIASTVASNLGSKVSSKLTKQKNE